MLLLRGATTWLFWLALLANNDVGGAAKEADDDTATHHFLKNETSHLNIQIPTKLHSVAGYPHSIAQFGNHFNFWSPSGNIIQRVVYDHQFHKLCHDVHVPVNGTVPPNAFTNPPFVIMVDRGDCTFVTKVRRAQQLGASAVLIANNQCLCNEPNCKDASDVPSGHKCVDDLPMVSNDGSGADVTIPSVLIQKTDGDAMKKVLKEKDGVLLADLSWHLPKYESKVTMDLFYSPMSTTSMNFLTNFTTLALAMGDSLEFTPHHHLLNGKDLGCIGKAHQKEEACYDLCTNNGRYCSVSHHKIPGKDVVTESLRRMCLWKHIQKDKDKKNHLHYFEYLNHFHDWCQSSDFFANEKCIEDAYKHSQVDKHLIDSCMKDSGDVTGDVSNTLLDQALSMSRHYGIYSTPSVFINKLPMMYTLTPQTALEALCAGFDTGKGPHVCYMCARCGDPVACASRSPMKCHADDGKDKEDSGKKGSSSETKKKKGGHFFRWVFIILMFGAAGGYVYYKKFVEDEDGGGGYSLTEAFMSDDTA